MGRLITIQEIKDSHLTDWYFEFGGKHLDKDSATKLECAIDKRYLDRSLTESPISKIEIRKFIDKQLDDTVILDYLSLSYYYWARPDEPCYLEREIVHGYYRFYFESETSQVQFALRFSEYISEKFRWLDDQVPSQREHLSRIWTPPTDRY